MSNTVFCSRCNYTNHAKTRYCVSCGLALGTPSRTRQASSSVPVPCQNTTTVPIPVDLPTPPFPHNLRTVFLDHLKGTVITLGPETQAPKKWSPWKLLMVVLVIMLLPFFVCTAIAMRIMGWGNNGSSTAQHLLLLNLSHVFGKSPEPTPSWDIRIKDQSGQEHAARLEGRDVSGPPAPGDSVILWGRMHHGTMVVDIGFNERTRSWMYL